ncbi:hypothetical protein COB21_01310 [Candidatus Aerophobetes bacterium]|uniref:Major facilitator superfamily (MFS) profile domain-containing protein n=1 Tax=Aerophobetes bacterium TaxID=2030807 RepID=A0A2A4X7K0_UNCAE|nr:MAG: hypothetical protein COB21_01310 [Candidatus Aerophobetes bacterium]
MHKFLLKWKSILPCLVAVFVDVLGLALSLPVLTIIFTSDSFFSEPVSDSMRLAYLSVGLAIYPLFMFFGSSVMGDLSDVIGRKKVLLFCMGGFVIGFCLMGIGCFARSLTLLFIGRALTGLTAASLPTTLAAISDMSSSHDKAANMSLVVLAQCLGFVLGPFIGGVLSDSSIVAFFSPAIPFYTAALFALVAFMWISFAYKDVRKPDTKKKIDPLRVVTVFVEVAKHARIRLLTLIFLLQQVGMALFIQLVLIYLRQYFHYSGFMLGMFNVFFGVIMCLGVVLVPMLTRKFRVEWLACITVGAMGLSQMLMLFTAHLQYFIWIIAMLIAVFGIIAWTAILASFSNAAESHVQGWALGITGSVVALSFFIGSFAPNLIPSLGAPFLIGLGGFCVVVAFLIFLYYCLKKMPPQHVEKKV